LVTAPDGSGRTVIATVPQGLSPGMTFMAEFPPSATSPPASVVSSSSAPPRPAQVEVEPVDYSKVTVLPPPSAHTGVPAEPFAQAVPIGAGPNDTTISASGSPNRPTPHPVSPTMSSPMPATFGQPMLQVQVPPGTAPASRLYVSIPGENRTIPAVVPPGNVSSFHVQYESSQQTAPAVVAAPVNNNQKLLLVRVPPGTAPGTMLHVSIPDEPGRVVAATVPPNVSEFQVAYQPSNNNHGASMNRGYQQPPQHNNNGGRNNNGGWNNNNYNNGGRNNNNYNNGQNNGMGSMLLPALGGAALGMMGMSMFDHAHHNNNDNAGDYDNGAYGDAGGDDYGGGGDAGDYGGGGDDYGGDYDGGGYGDFGDFGGDF